MKRIVYLLFLLAATPLWAASPLEEADNAYMQGHYEEAVTRYEALLEDGVSADACYNLGNAYYRLDDLGRAILNYERALLLAPADADIRFNLELCRSKLSEQWSKPSEMFFITWLREFVGSRNAGEWGTCGVLFFLFGILFFALYRFGGRLLVRKLGFYAALAGWMLAVLANVAAAWTYFSYKDDNRAVVVANARLYPDSNSGSEPLRTLSPGAVLQVTDANSRGWYEVELPNGKKGWMQQQDLEKIVP